MATVVVELTKREAEMAKDAAIKLTKFELEIMDALWILDLILMVLSFSLQKFLRLG